MVLLLILVHVGLLAHVHTHLNNLRVERGARAFGELAPIGPSSPLLRRSSVHAHSRFTLAATSCSSVEGVRLPPLLFGVEVQLGLPPPPRSGGPLRWCLLVSSETSICKLLVITINTRLVSYQLCTQSPSCPPPLGGGERPCRGWGVYPLGPGVCRRCCS